MKQQPIDSEDVYVSVCDEMGCNRQAVWTVEYVSEDGSQSTVCCACENHIEYICDTETAELLRAIWPVEG